MTQQGPFWISPDRGDTDFPDANLALTEPDGLLAAGGNLSPERLLKAYRSGIFPWYNDEQPILWWSPNPRSVVDPGQPKISRSLRKRLRQKRFEVSYDRCFENVINACAEPRKTESGTWISEAMKLAYTRLHQLGHAHSIECWQDDKLVGGLYGVSIGRVFFGESMFSRVNDASKVAFAHLVRQLADWQFELVDCQVYTSHLASLGAYSIPRQQFLDRLAILCNLEPAADAWQTGGELTYLSGGQADEA
ncbi:leucyl/phenylalanyl-tRNA--protein transferase [Thiogranum longum]|uniref:Leucyl/phenylalanyl-tRNA--protein transferase n=1 Tax=Thiogranum longum TaxID=1537524 RepID=A0A4R1HDQ3_9GAMM|nr:leucyl/phenylalanyl-tRNA--protein transferase [Thiogranum longum]TCK18290.1 leucyl/phenylalanyl-tRNA--protein transferase [Thiogranum longum]